MQAQALTGADIIVVSCSTLSPSVRLLRPEFNVPVVAIDDAMVREAVQKGSRIGLLATANSTVKPSHSALLAAAQAAGKDVDIQIICDEDAIRALKAGDKATHDRMVLEMARRFTDRDVIDKISEACQAGVVVVMIIRGITCIKANIPGRTEGLVVRQIVGK